MARAILELIGDADSLLRTFKRSSEAADMFGGHLKELSVTAEQSARAQVDAAVRRDARLRQEIATYRQVASAAKSGSREQVAAANLATRSEERLARALATTSREAREHARSVAKSEREVSRFGRGAIAGSGIARSLGRSLAFASGGFLVTASSVGLLRASIEAGSQAAATQKQLAAQFDSAHQSLKQYDAEIETSTSRVSALAGFTKDELTQAFVTAFRGSKDVTSSLRIQAIAADVARGRHIQLSAAALALTKAYGGQATALRRLGILVPTNLKGMSALQYVARRFAGQAAAGTTAQDRFRAALTNTEETIGLVLLPTFDRLLNTASRWLANEQNQIKIQHGVRTAMHETATVAHTLGTAFEFAAAGAKLLYEADKKLQKIRIGSPESKHHVSLGTNLVDLVKLFPGSVGRAAHILTHPFGHDPTNVQPSTRPGQSTSDRAPGRSERGAGAFQAALAADAARSGPLGFAARFAVAELALAQAQLTKTQADDRKILKLEADLLRERIKTLGTGRKTLAERTTLTQQLVSVEGQITSIETDAASKVDAARKKRLTAEQKAAREAYRLRTLALRNEAQRLAAEKSADTKQLAALKQSDRALTSKIKTIQDNFKAALSTARQGIGDLFSGPVLNFSDEQRKAALGIPNPAADPKTLVKDLNAQVKQAAAFQRDLARLSKRGAPASLVKELQAGGQANATEVAALAGASRGTLKEFFKAFGAREKLVQNIAHAQMHAQLVTLHADRVRLSDVRRQENHFTIYINDVEQKQAKVKVKQSAVQRRGPVPGRG